MAKKITPGVILSSRFVFSDQQFHQYIDYIDRSEAVRSNAYSLYSAYTDYMDNPEKQRKTGLNTKSERASALFTETKDRMTLREKQELKQQFIKAQQAGSPMWQNVISFTNEFLEQNGMYDHASGLLDEEKIRTVTRLAMEEMLKDESMEASAVWSASIHYNTDNIHVHIAVVEPTPTRKKKEYSYTKPDGTTETKVEFRGSIKKKTFERMKSQVVNHIVDRAPELTKINDIIRKDIVAEKREHLSTRDTQLRGAFLNLYRKLPENRRFWQYNMNALHSIRPQIDHFTKMYLSLYHRKDLSELNHSLMEQEKFLKSVYGSGKEKLYKNYADNKMKELYTRMGNAVLRELRDYDKTIRAGQQSSRSSISARQRLKEKGALARNRSSSLYHLKKAFRKDYLQAKNLMQFNNLQQQIEQEIEQ